MAEATIAQANAASTSTIERRKTAREVKSLQRVGEAPGAIRKKIKGDFPFSRRHVNPMWPHSIRWSLGC